MSASGGPKSNGNAPDRLIVRLLACSLLLLLISLVIMWVLRNVMAPLVQTGTDPLTAGGCGGLAVVTAMTLFAVVRHRPRLKLGLTILIMAAAAGFTGGVVLAWIGNAALASGPVERRVLPIVAAESRFAGRGPERQVVVVPSWVQQNATIELEVGRQLRRYADGGCIEVELRPGAFGAARLSHHRPVPCPGP